MNVAWVAAPAVVVIATRVRTRCLTARRPSVPHRQKRPLRSPTTVHWADLLDAIAAEVRSGHSLSVGYTIAMERAEVHGDVLRPGCAFAALATSVSQQPDEALVLHALTTAASLGGHTAATLQAAAGVLRERAAVRDEATAQSAQARLSARVLTAVPVLFAAWSALTSSSFRTALVSPFGAVAAALGVLGNLAGWAWMRHLVSSVAP